MSTALSLNQEKKNYQEHKTTAKAQGKGQPTATLHSFFDLPRELVSQHGRACAASGTQEWCSQGTEYLGILSIAVTVRIKANIFRNGRGSRSNYPVRKCANRELGNNLHTCTKGEFISATPHPSKPWLQLLARQQTPGSLGALTHSYHITARLPAGLSGRRHLLS